MSTQDSAVAIYRQHTDADPAIKELHRCRPQQGALRKCLTSGIRDKARPSDHEDFRTDLLIGRFRLQLRW